MGCKAGSPYIIRGHRTLKRKQEIKVFFVKYNDPIYVKLEKLDIKIRLASQGNIAQVLAELKEYATHVDVDFVHQAVRAIGRCAIKVEKFPRKLYFLS
ncbi:AP-2 complex subunit beta [Manis javanica]|nr:AP-2 complex subunit beta [Manis javanica]